MFSQQARQLACLVALLDGLLLSLAFFVALTVRTLLPLPGLSDGITLDPADHVWLLFVSLPSYLLLGVWFRSFTIAPGRSLAREGLLLLRCFSLLAVSLGTAIFVFQAKDFSRAVFFLFLVLGTLMIGSGRLVLRALSRWFPPRPKDQRSVLIVGSGEMARAVRERIESHPEFGLRVVGQLGGPPEAPPGTNPSSVPGSFSRLRAIVDEDVIDEVIFALALEDLARCRDEIRWCEEVGVTVHLQIDLARTFAARTYPTELEGLPMLTLSPTPREAVSLLVKRLLDASLSLLALVLLAPLMIVVALLVKMTSRGPTLFSQNRVGLNGRSFTLYKFRSMYVDAEERRREVEALNQASGPVFKMRDDPRVTPVGRWLRRFSLDELPQLWNVLAGDMSLVGPRPPLPREVARYERWQRRRLSMRPGLTCLWQVSGRSLVGFDEWMKLDLAYIDNWSLGLDLKILARTVPAVLLARGAH